MEVSIDGRDASPADAEREARLHHKELPSLASLASARAMMAKPTNGNLPNLTRLKCAETFPIGTSGRPAA